MATHASLADPGPGPQALTPGKLIGNEIGNIFSILESKRRAADKMKYPKAQFWISSADFEQFDDFIYFGPAAVGQLQLLFVVYSAIGILFIGRSNRTISSEIRSYQIMSPECNFVSLTVVMEMLLIFHVDCR